MESLESTYIEWVEDLGLSKEQILITLLEKEIEKNQYLEKRLEDPSASCPNPGS
jgi:hypothetical protein